MKIVFLHDLDTGFMAATLKPAFQALGHKVTVLQTVQTYLESNIDHVDVLLSDKPDLKAIAMILKDTDFFILRSVTDITLRLLNMTKYANHKNTIYKVHGSELRENNIPYSLLTYRTIWSKHPLTVCGPRDPSLVSGNYRQGVITHIERPCDFSLIPRKRIKDIYALHTPTNMQRKGTQRLLDRFTDKGDIQLRILSGISRKTVLKAKAGASFFIDHLGSYPHGPYGMNSVEAWYLRVPVFSNIRPIDRVFCPQITQLNKPFNIDTLHNDITNFEPDKNQLNYAHNYAKRVHDPLTIAQQYIALANHLKEIEQ